MPRAASPSLYKIPGTKVTSPYPVQLTPAEVRLIFSLQHFFSPSYILPDCYFPKPDRGAASSALPAVHTTASSAHLTQIDCIALSQQGIFVFESKDYSGWIYGASNSAYWTAVLDFGREKHQFYNPIRQNSQHIAALPNSEIRKIHIAFPIYSIIVFGRSATLKSISSVPDNTYVCTQSTLPRLLAPLLQAPPLISAAQLDELQQIFLRSRITPNSHLRHTHIAEIQSAKTAHNYSHSSHSML